MSRTRDLVGFMTGDVRVSVNELDINERIRLFRAFMALTSKRYRISRGGRLFLSWGNATMDSLGTIKESPGFQLRTSQGPKEESYNSETRIHVLMHATFDFPGCDLHIPRRWEKGAKVAFCRVCLTQDGNFWFEWYEAVVENNIRTASVRKVHYTQLSHRQESDLGRLGVLLEMHPCLLDHFCHSALELMDEEVRQREALAKQDRDLLTTLAMIGKPFNISLTSH